MLLDSIRRFDVKKQVKLVNIVDLQKTHPSVFQQLKMVPALMVLPSREILYGKMVFDYLLLPSRGKLVSGPSSQPTQQQGGNMNMSTAPSNQVVGILHEEEGVMAFNSAKGQYGDSFASIDEQQSTPEYTINNPHSAYSWTSIDEMVSQGQGSQNQAQPAPSAIYKSSTQPMVGSMPFEVGVETRNIKEEYDIDKLRVQREQDMQSMFNTQTRPVM